MHRRFGRPIFAVLLLLVSFCLASKGQAPRAQKAPGSDFQHPIYLELEAKGSDVRDVGDYLLRRDIVYILRLEAGQKLKSKIATAFTDDRSPSVITIFLIDGRARSFEDAQVLDRKPGALDRTQKPNMISASVTYTAPITADYFLVADFQGAGVDFALTANAGKSDIPKRNLTCVTGPVLAPTFLSPGVSNSLISDLTIGDPTKTDPPDEHNRHFCLSDGCKVRPPTSFVLNIKLRDAFEAKKRVRSCWDLSNTITEVISLP